MQETTNYESNNEVVLTGLITKDAEFSHEAYGEKFYNTSLSIPRTSGYNDIIPIIVSERLVNPENLVHGRPLSVKGQIRTFNKIIEGCTETITVKGGFVKPKTKLIINVFVREIIQLYEIEDDFAPENSVVLDGYIVKKPVFRRTPQGRDITDVLLAVNRAYKKSDYIPALLWGRNAHCASDFIVGDKICVTGRIQSREYNKKLSETESEIRVAYEVSINSISNVEYAPEKSNLED